MTENLVERQDLLIAQLRSGNYSQCEGRLRGNAGGFCCLGVASDIYAKATGLAIWDMDSHGLQSFVKNEYADQGFVEIADGDSTDTIRVRSGSVLIKDVEKWFGFKDETGRINGDPIKLEEQENLASSLLGLNDNGVSFSSIADIIELRRKDIFND